MENLENLDNIQWIVTWGVWRNEDGTFGSRVYSYDNNKPEVVHARYTRSTREEAFTAARIAGRYVQTKQESPALPRETLLAMGKIKLRD